MMRKLTLLATAIAALVALVSCVDRTWEDAGLVNEKGEVKTTLCFAQAEMPEVTTRNATSDYTLESVVLFVFNESGALLKSQYQPVEGNPAMVSIYLPTGQDIDVRAVCNLQDPEALLGSVQSLADLQAASVSLTEADQAFRGKYVMYGQKDMRITTNGSSVAEDVRTVEVSRLAAQLNFRIKFDPEVETDQFELTDVKVYNVPKGSWIVPRERAGGESEYNGHTGDWVYNAATATMQNRFFSGDYRLQTETESPSTGETAQWIQTASFSMFENRRGSVETQDPEPNDYSDTYWPGSSSMTDELKETFRQLYKRNLALYVTEDGRLYTAQTLPADAKLRFRYATYVTIEGIYQSAAGTWKTTYYIYVGKDNYKDFNIERNTKYTYDITLKTVDRADTRVEADNLSDMTLSMPDDILDAHCNSQRAVLYAFKPWKVWVVDPDKTPWLELSEKAVYQGRKLGMTDEEAAAAGCATYQLSGTQGILKPVYIHTDEYLPEGKSPADNSRMKIREGKIAYQMEGKAVQYLTVRQYPAQMVVLHIKYDVHTMKEVRDTFYIERVLEKKHMPWGFEKYWSFVTDDLIASGQWDGLSNTRKLYDVGLNGDKWGVEPAYPDAGGTLPTNMALGYTVQKNRDRNGNGLVDYDEIMWYLPAVKELGILREAIDAGQLGFEATDDYFHSSTPSSADPASGAVTVGFSYYVKMASGKQGIGQRNREYNVICCRRRNSEWRGPQAGDAQISVEIETEWGDEEVIMPNN